MSTVTILTSHKWFQMSVLVDEGRFEQSVTSNEKNSLDIERIQVSHSGLSSNTIASIQQVSEDNLKEFLVSILHPCIYSQTNYCKCVVHVKKRCEKQILIIDLPNFHSNIKHVFVFVRFTLCNNFIN
jgi:hypothetical protein